jgi:hypothetical protein
MTVEDAIGPVASVTVPFTKNFWAGATKPRNKRINRREYFFIIGVKSMSFAVYLFYQY